MIFIQSEYSDYSLYINEMFANLRSKKEITEIS